VMSADRDVTRGSIGIEFNARPDPALARVYGVNSGVTVANVRPGGPADQAGLKVGDTIIKVNGKKVTNGNGLVAEISDLPPGSKTQVAFVRNGKEQETAVTIADRAKLFSDRLGDEENAGEEEKPVESKLGMTVKNI